MLTSKNNKRIVYLFTLLNLAIGWHLLYEGLIKWADPTWSSYGYLTNASGPLAGFFHQLASNAFWLQVADIMTMLLLSTAGLLLILGLFTRFAAIIGAILLGLFYLAHPPFAATEVGYASEGHYLVINKNLVEMLTLITIAFIPTSWYYGFDKILPNLKKVKVQGRVQVPAEMNHNLSSARLDRRALVKNLISIPVLGGFAFAFAKNHGWKSFEEHHLEQTATDATTAPTVKVQAAVDLSQLKKPIAKGVLGNQEIGRMICGGNLISGFAHSRDLIYVSNFLKQYFTEKKVMDTFWLCEQCGIDTTAISARPNEARILNQYWKDGGKMKWLAPVYPTVENYKENIDMAIDNGAFAAMIMGNVGDSWAREDRADLLRTTIDYIKSKGVPAGLAGHELATIKYAEEHQVGAEFYMKTLHSKKYWSWKPEQAKDKMIIDNYSVDNYWSRMPEDTISYMNNLAKPWIAFKILAAGAIHPREGLRYAFENGADFACVGMFDFQVVENANLLTEILEGQNFNRQRQWMA